MEDNSFPSAIKKYRELPDGVYCEVLYNNIINTARPNVPHQFLATRVGGLLYKLLETAKTGVGLKRPTDVYLERQQAVVQPDVFVMMNNNLDIIREDAIYGAPDIIFEIICGNRDYDLITKKSLYEEAGVKEYFVIDPSSKLVVMFALNTSGKYEVVYELTGKITSGILATSFDI